MGAVVGIDLGTTNTVVAAVRDGRPVALPDESGSPLIPSIVSFLPSGAVLVGSAAKERRSQDPRNTIYSVKRLIGRTWDSSEVQLATTRFPFEMREGPGRATFVIARGETYTLPEISAFVLRKAKSIAELELGETVDRAVITVPANFNDLQRAATKVAGRVAGLEVLRILNEPTAAALAFGHSRGNRQRIAIYDFGGGTFDLTILLLTDDVMEVLATAGDTFLGGDDIDAAIVERMANQLVPSTSGDLRAQPETLERLRAAAEQLKLQLSEADEALVRLADHEILSPTALEFGLTRAELDGLVDPIVARTFQVCRDALAMASLTPRDVDHVLLVGGTTRIPLVKQRVEEYFGRRARADLDPHEVVALGAAQQAMALTQVRATASGIPVAPPPRPGMPTHTSPASGGESDEITHRRRFESIELLRKQTDPGVGDASGGAPDDAVAPGRVSVVPPEGPLTNPAPTTQTFGSRERKTTGIGLGPDLGPDINPLPLVGIEPVPVARELLEHTMPPSTLSGLGPKATATPGAPVAAAMAAPAAPIAVVRGTVGAPGTAAAITPATPDAAVRSAETSPGATTARGPKPNPGAFAAQMPAQKSPVVVKGSTSATTARSGQGQSPGSPAAARRDAGPTPDSPQGTVAVAAVTDKKLGAAATSSPRRDFSREPTVRVTRGEATTPDLASTLTSAAFGDARGPLNRPDIPRTDPLAAAVVGPDVPVQDDQVPRTDPLFAAIVRPDPIRAAAPQRTESANRSPTIAGKSPRETIPDELEPWLEPASATAVDHGLPLVTPHSHVGLERTAQTQLSHHHATGTSTTTDLLADLPIVVAHTPNQIGDSTERRPIQAASPTATSLTRPVSPPSAESRLGLPDPGWGDSGTVGDDLLDEASDHEADEPTVIRRSAQSVSDSTFPPYRQHAATDLDLTQAVTRDGDRATRPDPFTPDDLPAIGGAGLEPALLQRSGKASSPNEDEIRARYGNLPLIVGGKRVGQRTPEHSVAPQRSTSDRPSSSHANAPAPDVGIARSPDPVSAPQPDVVTGVQALVRASADEPLPIALGGATTRPVIQQPAQQAKAMPVVLPKAQPAPLPLTSLAPDDLVPEEFEAPDELTSAQVLPKAPENQQNLLQAPSPIAMRAATQGVRLQPGPISTGLSPAAEEPIPKSARLHSSRPAARQNPNDELELPIPDLPPLRPEPTIGQRTDVNWNPARNFGAGAPTATPIQTGMAVARGPVDPSRPALPPQVTLPLAVGSLTTSAWQPPAARVNPNDAPSQPEQKPVELQVPSLLGSLPRPVSTRPTLLIDVTPFSLCVETVSGYVDVLVARNTPVPCERTRDFVTAHDNQQSVIVRVAQGESKLFHENVLLGEVQLSGIPAALRGHARIAVTFGIDSDGILHVRALDVTSGQSALADLQLSGAPTPPEIAQMIARHAAKS